MINLLVSLLNSFTVSFYYLHLKKQTSTNKTTNGHWWVLSVSLLLMAKLSLHFNQLGHFLLLLVAITKLNWSLHNKSRQIWVQIFFIKRAQIIKVKGSKWQIMKAKKQNKVLSLILIIKLTTNLFKKKESESKYACNLDTKRQKRFGIGKVIDH